MRTLYALHHDNSSNNHPWLFVQLLVDDLRNLLQALQSCSRLVCVMPVFSSISCPSCLLDVHLFFVVVVYVIIVIMFSQYFIVGSQPFPYFPRAFYFEPSFTSPGGRGTYPDGLSMLFSVALCLWRSLWVPGYPFHNSFFYRPSAGWRCGQPSSILTYWLTPKHHWLWLAVGSMRQFFCLFNVKPIISLP